MPSNPHKEAEALLAGCVAGADGAWEEFLSRYGRLIALTVNTACFRCDGHGREEKDLVSHVYQKLIENDFGRLRAWRGESRFTTYLVQVTKNLSIDYLRRKQPFFERNHMTPMDDSRNAIQVPGVPPSDATVAEDLDRLRAAIDGLSPKQRLIMRLRMKGHSLREIAGILNVPRGSVFAGNSRALEILRKVLNDGRKNDHSDEKG